MADEERGQAPQRGHGAFQPIEALDDSGSHRAPGPPNAGRQAPSTASPPPQAPRTPPSAESADRPTSPGPAAAAPAPEPQPSAVVVDYAVRFGSAASALAFAGQVHAIGAVHPPMFGVDAQHGWWVIAARLPLDVGREFAAAAHGEAHVLFRDPGVLVSDTGWGEPPRVVARDDPAAVWPAGYHEVEVRELIRVAGLYPRAERALPRAHVLLPGRLTADVVRRASDLRLDVEHRAVRLHPLFAAADTSADTSVQEDAVAVPGDALSENAEPAGASANALAVIELRLSASAGEVSRGFLAALAANPQLTVCRAADEHGSILIEYGMAAALPDHQLAALGIADSWLLSRGRLGARSLEPQSRFEDGAALLRLANGHPMDVQSPVEHDARPATVPVRVVRARTPGRDVDALLLATDDLEAVGLVLEGHPLADRAWLVPGRDRHLLLAPGGLLDYLPLGESLYCWGPGPLYLPLGFATSPDVPPSARGTLFGAGADAAIVVLPEARLHFDLTLRRPAWQLWIGEAPQVDEQLPVEVLEELQEIEEAARLGAGGTESALGDADSGDESDAAAESGESRGRRRAKRWRFGRSQAMPDEAAVPATADTVTWLDEALAAELGGALVRAADLHARHGDPVRAAHLYERAAMEGSNR